MGPIFGRVFADIGKASPTIAYVGAANGDSPDFFQRMAGLLQGVTRCTVVHALLVSRHADIKKATKMIESADAVFVSGGDVEAGMDILKERDIARVLAEMHERGKLFFGVSAGSIMLAREWVRWKDPDDDSTAELFPCIGLAPVICDTHGEGEGWEELQAAVGLSLDGTVGYGITSGACLRVDPGGGLTAVGGPIATYARLDGRVVRQADIVVA
jgi:cyanophycinase-like exopeptidase